MASVTSVCLVLTCCYCTFWAMQRRQDLSKGNWSHWQGSIHQQLLEKFLRLPGCNYISSISADTCNSTRCLVNDGESNSFTNGPLQWSHGHLNLWWTSYSTPFMRKTGQKWPAFIFNTILSINECFIVISLKHWEHHVMTFQILDQLHSQKLDIVNIYLHSFVLSLSAHKWPQFVAVIRAHRPLGAVVKVVHLGWQHTEEDSSKQPEGMLQ